jgi:hypothetical protein
VQIKVGHLLFMPELLLPLPAEAELLLRLFLLRLPRHAVLCTTELQLPEGPLVHRLLQPNNKLLRLQSSQLQLQAGLQRPLVQRLRGLLRLRLRLRRRPRAVPVVVVLQRPAAAAFLLQVPVVVLRGGDVLRRQGGLLQRLVPRRRRRPGGAVVVPGVLVRLRVLLSPVQRRVPVPAVR